MTKVLRQILAGAGLALMFTCASAAEPGTQQVKLNIDASHLSRALIQLTEQTGLQLIYPAGDKIVDLPVRPLAGTYTPQAALDRLLQGSGLKYEFIDARTIAITEAGAAPTSSSLTNSSEKVRLALVETPPAAQKPTNSNAAAASSGEVVVTGTHIRGAEVASPVLTITSEEMRRSGHFNLGEVVRALPQNFAGGQNPSVSIGSVTSANYTGSSSLNLRGLGADATLTLLNGARMPYDGTIQATDVSVIPVAAIERMEILLDGASAIYGSDAVGGVANIILKRDFQGLELSARAGTATEGGYDQQQYTAVTGTTWGSGGILASADYSRNNAIFARQRDYLRSVPNGNITLFPEFDQKGALISGHQQFGERVELLVDAFYTDRKSADVSQTTVRFDYTRDSTIWGIAPALRIALSDQWSLRLHGAIGSNESDQFLRGFNPVTGAELASVSPRTLYTNEAETAGVGVEGALFNLPGGAARLSLGAGYRRNTFEQLMAVTGVKAIAGSARSSHGFAEVNLPVLDQLTLNGALRYEDDKTFGEVTTPKFGAIWTVLPGFDLKASWGKSFKAPTLVQQFQAPTLYLYPTAFFPGLPAGTNAILATGGRRDLDPEHAEVITAGFIFRPEALEGFSLEVNWFDIEYTDRVVSPITNLAQTTNPAFADFVTLTPSVQQQNDFFTAAGFAVGTFTANGTGGAYNPATVSALINNRLANATADRASGVDVMTTYTKDMFGGRMSFTANGSWLDAERQLTTRAPMFDASGVNFFPAKFKGRLGASWARGAWALTGNVNHVDSVRNTNFVIVTEGGSMTTLDLIADYQAKFAMLGEMGFNLAVINVANRRPPYLQASQAFYVPFDSTNYSSVGRTINAMVTKRF